MEMKRVAAPEFNLAATLASGQVFHWDAEGEGYLGVLGGRAVYVEQQGEGLVTDGEAAEVARYFALDHPLGEIYRTFPKDAAMAAALEYCQGLRVIRQPAWECVATFITSSMKQVAHIAQISHTLRERYGEAVCWRGGGEARMLYQYPGPERLAQLEEGELRGCALGYRAKNLLKAARMVAEGEVDLEGIRTMEDEEARKELMRLGGVGEKVANCVLLFAYERVRAFPIDVWIARVLKEAYFQRKRKVTARRLREFSARYFGEYGGYAQQYLFHHARSLKRRKSAAGRRKEKV